ncbi:MAG TPA: hypothetical protein VHX86_12710 [Tepidisphaeraceae bacterium]|nr:hypothetical protein [Tepidisphaeraceae bacterium]
MFALSKGQVVRYHIDEDQGEHQHHHGPDSPISVSALPKVVAWVSVIPRPSSFTLYVVLGDAHSVPIKKPTRRNTTSVLSHRLTL